MNKCVALVAPIRDGAGSSAKHEGVVAQRSTTLPPNSTGSVGLLVERNESRGAARPREDALEDVNEARHYFTPPTT
jgi:hypothetical protein